MARHGRAGPADRRTQRGGRDWRRTARGHDGLARAEHRGRPQGPVASTRSRGCPTPRSSHGAPSTAPNKFAEAEKEPRWRLFVRQYRDPMQIVLLVAGIVSLFLPGQFATGVVLVLLTLLNAFLGLNQEGKAEASVAALQKMMVVKARVRRGGEVVDRRHGGHRPRRHRHGRGGRSRPRRRPPHPVGDARDRRVGADRRERPGPEAARCSPGGFRARRPGRPGVHEHPGDPWRGHDPRDLDRDVDRGRPHLAACSSSRRPRKRR